MFELFIISASVWINDDSTCSYYDIISLNRVVYYWTEYK